MRFIDLFAGLGGFHLALSELGHECVFASELDIELAQLYHSNFGLLPAGDIRKVPLKKIPKHDILCAGFPCQPFSKAGDQRGLRCPQWGDLIDYVIRILKYHKPKFFIIENVPNLVRHNNGKTWAGIKKRLEDSGYEVQDQKLSPHMFGIPQIRERAFIVGCRNGLGQFSWPQPKPQTKLDISSVLDKRPAEGRPIPKHLKEYLRTWQIFLNSFPKKEELPSFPIWAMEFGATYPFEKSTPHASYKKLSKYRGSFGKPLRAINPDKIMGHLPPYAREMVDEFPDWKIDFIRKNRSFYTRHKKQISKWLPRIKNFPASFQKLEWNCKGGERNIWKYVIQFRASGIRIKQPTKAPSLVAMTISQVPIIAWEQRYMTPRECSRLQSMQNLKYLPTNRGKAYKALGNAVNASVVRAIAKQLVGSSTKKKAKKVAKVKPHITRTNLKGLYENHHVL